MVSISKSENLTSLKKKKQPINNHFFLSFRLHIAIVQLINIFLYPIALFLLGRGKICFLFRFYGWVVDKVSNLKW